MWPKFPANFLLPAAPTCEQCIYAGVTVLVLLRHFESSFQQANKKFCVIGTLRAEGEMNHRLGGVGGNTKKCNLQTEQCTD